MKKRIWALTLCVLFLISLLPGNYAFAADEFTVRGGKATAMAGEDVSVDIVLENNPGFSAINLYYTYNTDYFTLSRVENKATWFTMTHVTTTVWDAVYNYAENGTLATLHFSIAENTPAGEYEIQIVFLSASNDMFEEVTAKTVAAIITVEEEACPHTDKTEVPAKSADCVNPGNNRYYTCGSCGLVLKADGVTETTVDAETIPALGHNWSEKLQDAAHLKDSANNCAEYHTYWYDCSRCDAISDTEYFASTVAGNHSYTEKLEDAAHLVAGSGENCQSAKQYYYDCAYCDAIGTEIWSSATYGEHRMATAWTTENGKHFHKCTVSGCTYIEDEAACSGGNATCEEEAVCGVCGVAYGELGEHDLEEVPSKSPDCVNSGNHLYYVCSVCGQAFKADGVTKTTADAETIPANGHSYTEKLEDAAHLVAGSGENCQSVKRYYYDCAACDSIGSDIWDSTTYGEHKLATGWTTENGEHFHACTVEGCDYVADKATCSGGNASCTEKAVCSVCNTPYGDLATHDYKTEWNEGDASGHWHDCKNCSAHDAAVAHTPNVDAATEETAKYCTVCGYVIEAQLSHTHKTTKVEGFDANCTEAGQKTYYTCNCGKWFEDSTANVEITDKNRVMIPALGHDLAEATCTAPATCQRKGCTYTEGTALGHDWSEKLQDAAHLKDSAHNCAEYHTYWYDCSRCDAISDTEYFTSTTAGNHSFTEKLEDAAHLVAGSGENCQSAKQYYYDCAYCDVIGTEIWSSTTYGEHKLATGWTTENGEHFHVCTVEGCDYVADKAACSGGNASCTEKAVCSVCNTPYGDLTAHDYKTEWNQGDASGHWHDCKNCSAHDTAVAHTPNVGAATEETAKYCTVCGYVIEAQLSHTHKTTKVEGFDATCTEAGQKTYYICACGHWFEDATALVEITNKDSVIIAALGHDLTDATCTAPAICQREGCAYTEGNALGHEWKDATCTDPKTCERCGASEGDALGHTESDWNSDKKNHWKVCTAEGCGAEIEGSKAAHADADKDALCDTCGHEVPLADPSNPQTGDAGNLLLWTALLIISMAGIFLLVDKKYLTR